ncbi:Gfo/Idh/MocA family protein [Nonomuraea aridisoli]|uniref:Gfo/Idh/MocA family protein n=1 Tax=Nonomuraea aridisoli TaxID=2070368 RepID=UPI001C653C77|nr:Gfo/Idh/MocA family oxidoreductase [Nonomuraea aridisoli]
MPLACGREPPGRLVRCSSRGRVLGGGRTVTLAVVGAGSRRLSYARHATATGRAQVVAVADPVPARRAKFPSAAPYADWREFAALPRQADAVIIATQDRDHVESALRFAELGYDILLEKPMGVSQDECRAIVAAAERSDAIFAVCHVLRYTPYTKTLKALLDAGRIGTAHRPPPTAASTARPSPPARTPPPASTSPWSAARSGH